MGVITIIAIEGKCLYFISKEKQEVPKCCKYEPGVVGKHCLLYDESKYMYCKYLGIATARAQILLTNSDGDVVNSKGFWGDLDMSENDWVKEENKWILKQNKEIF